MTRKRRRPWRVFVWDIGPTFSFGSKERAFTRAHELLGEYTKVSVTDFDSWVPGEPWTRTMLTADGRCWDEHFVQGQWHKVKKVAS